MWTLRPITTGLLETPTQDTNGGVLCRSKIKRGEKENSGYVEPAVLVPLSVHRRRLDLTPWTLVVSLSTFIKFFFFVSVSSDSSLSSTLKDILKVSFEVRYTLCLRLGASSRCLSLVETLVFGADYKSSCQVLPLLRRITSSRPVPEPLLRLGPDKKVLDLVQGIRVGRTSRNFLFILLCP